MRSCSRAAVPFLPRTYPNPFQTSPRLRSPSRHPMPPLVPLRRPAPFQFPPQGPLSRTGSMPQKGEYTGSVSVDEVTQVVMDAKQHPFTEVYRLEGRYNLKRFETELFGVIGSGQVTLELAWCAQGAARRHGGMVPGRTEADHHFGARERLVFVLLLPVDSETVRRWVPPGRGGTLVLGCGQLGDACRMALRYARAIPPTKFGETQSPLTSVARGRACRPAPC